MQKRAGVEASVNQGEPQLKPNHLFLDQFGEPIWARTVKELREKVGGGRVSTMYRDKKDGSVVRCGYVIGRRWFSRFAPVEVPA
jgi:hypothetical protein